MVKRYRIEYDRSACIGATICVQTDPKNWIMSDDVKADLLNGQKQASDGLYVKEMEDEDMEDLLNAARSCPVRIIRVKDLETGDYLV